MGDTVDATESGVVAPRASRAAPRVFRGWYIVASGFWMMFYSTGVGFYGFSAFIDQIADSVANGSRAVVAGAVSVQRLESGIMGPIIGFLVDRVGPRIILITGFAIAGLGFILVSRATNVFQFYAAYLFLALGLGAGSFLVISTAVSNWFIRYRGRALAIVFLGPGFSTFLVTLLVWSIEEIGWRDTLALVGVGTWVVGIPLSLVFRHRPEDVGLLPDGDLEPEPGAVDGQPVDQTGPPASTAPPETDFTVGAVLRMRSYWQYVIATSIQSAGFSALVIFQIPALKSYGLTPATAGTVVLFWGIGSIPGRVLGGYLADKFDKRLIFAGSIIVQMVGIGFLVTADSFAEALAYALIHGSGWGATTPSRLALQGEYWGRSIFGRLMGLQMGLSAFGGILSPLFVGWMFDRYGTYDTAFVILFVPLVLCFALVLTMRRPQMTTT
jgi:MFS family permease